MTTILEDATAVLRIRDIDTNLLDPITVAIHAELTTQTTTILAGLGAELLILIIATEMKIVHDALGASAHRNREETRSRISDSHEISRMDSSRVLTTSSVWTRADQTTSWLSISTRVLMAGSVSRPNCQPCPYAKY